jgi:hypothetical protein
MPKNHGIGAPTKQELDEYFNARNRKLTELTLKRMKDHAAAQPMINKPVEYVELFIPPEGLRRVFHILRERPGVPQKRRGFQRPRAGLGR